ncbi:MAG TPA: hypothetical protein VFS05_11050 [Gemmatimonadaceae bacterium]|nr:hypothetical protein [Gemmatimonadaceae bacterium]
MREILMYCSARDQDVHVVITDEPVHDGQAPLLDSEVICLEIGDRCTGHLCPVCALPAEAMDARLAKSGLRPEIRRSVRGHCRGCGRETELVLSSGGYVSCTECGTTSRWRVAG